VLEALSRVRAVAFDKTGTLTGGGLSVLRVDTPGGAAPAEVLGLLLALEEGTKHPVGQAITEHARLAGASPALLKTRVFKTGSGVEGTDAEGRGLLCGSPSWLASCGVPEALAEDTGARVVLARDGRVLARVAVGEVVRPEAKAALDALRDLGLGAFMLTGDGSKGAAETAASLGLAAYTGLSAQDKVRALERSGGAVAMVGDGLNDAPALAGTRPSFAVHGGTDLARGMAQVALLCPDLRLVPWTIALARRACSIARTNLIASTAYNLVFLSLAAAGALRPVWAGLSMATSSLLVLASASRVGAFRGPGDEEPS
jgi:Cu+-exporting ATPase